MGERAGQQRRSPGSSFGGSRLFEFGGFIGFVFAVILGIALTMSVIFNGIQLALNDRDHLSTEPIEVDIGTVGYSIPGNYVSVVPQGEPGSHQFVRLMVLRRGFEPRTRENAAEWKTWDEDGRQIGAWNPGGTVRITISNTGYPRVGPLERYVREGAYPAESTDYGLVRYAGGHLDSTDLAHYVADDDDRAGNGGPIIIICDPSIGRMPELYDVSMDCRSGYQLPDGAWVRYEYYTNDLSDWRRIDEQVRALISGFARTQPMPG